MGRAIRLGAPALAVLLLAGAVLLVVLLSNDKSSRHGGSAIAGGAGRPADTSGATKAAETADASRGGPGKAGSTSAAAPGGAGTSNGGTPAASGTRPGGSTQTTGAGVRGVVPGSGNSTGTTGLAAPSTTTPDGTLASNRSETGSWAVTSSLGPELEGFTTRAMISFSPPLAHRLGEEEVTYVSEAETKKAGSLRSSKIRAACGDTGTLETPTAMPGHLCVYAGLEDFRDRNPSGGVPTHDVHGKQVPFIDAEFFAIVNPSYTDFATAGTNRTGAGVAFGVPDIRTAEEEAHDAFAHITASGTWAVTAP